MIFFFSKFNPDPKCLFPNPSFRLIYNPFKRNVIIGIGNQPQIADNVLDLFPLIKFYPGMEPEMFEFLSGRYEGIILEVAALGHVAIDEARRNLLPTSALRSLS